jgi:hypothetical protein
MRNTWNLDFSSVTRDGKTTIGKLDWRKYKLENGKSEKKTGN